MPVLALGAHLASALGVMRNKSEGCLAVSAVSRSVMHGPVDVLHIATVSTGIEGDGEGTCPALPDVRNTEMLLTSFTDFLYRLFEVGAGHCRGLS